MHESVVIAPDTPSGQDAELKGVIYGPASGLFTAGLLDPEFQKAVDAFNEERSRDQPNPSSPERRRYENETMRLYVQNHLGSLAIQAAEVIVARPSVVELAERVRTADLTRAEQVLKLSPDEMKLPMPDALREKLVRNIIDIGAGELLIVMLGVEGAACEYAHTRENDNADSVASIILSSSPTALKQAMWGDTDQRHFLYDKLIGTEGKPYETPSIADILNCERHASIASGRFIIDGIPGSRHAVYAPMGGFSNPTPNKANGCPQARRRITAHNGATVLELDVSWRAVANQLITARGYPT